MPESIHEFAWKEIVPLLAVSAVRARFESQCREYLSYRMESPERALPLDSKPPYKVCEMYALLAATHDGCCIEEKPVYPVPSPDNTSDSRVRFLSPRNTAWRALRDKVISYASATPDTNQNPRVMSDALQKLKHCLKNVKQDLKGSKGTEVLEVIDGGIRFGESMVDLRGKPLGCIRELVDASQNRLDWHTLRDRVWGDAYTEKGTVKNAMKDARDALRKLARKLGRKIAGDYDPLPCVNHGKDLAWKLNFPG